MSSRAFYQSGVAPQLIHRWCRNSRAVEVWTTTCIVTNFGKPANCSTLVNPANPELSGVSNFPYFPRGGPVPKEKPYSMHKDWQPLGYVSTWGGMEVGSGMMFPVSVVDGLVHLHGGWKLQAACAWHRLQRNPPCPIGSAIRTTAADQRLLDQYQAIVHTAPPFYQHDEKPEEGLHRCYQSSLDIAFGDGDTRVAFPLIGAGARGFPENVAAQIAGQAMAEWASQDDGRQLTVSFGLLSTEIAEVLVDELLRNE